MDAGNAVSCLLLNINEFTAVTFCARGLKGRDAAWSRDDNECPCGPGGKPGSQSTGKSGRERREREKERKKKREMEE